ncbi:hypothetical protein [Kibdelosporangium philippinense]
MKITIYDWSTREHFSGEYYVRVDAWVGSGDIRCGEEVKRPL